MKLAVPLRGPAVAFGFVVPTAMACAAETPVTKTLRFDTADHPEVAGKTEGMALLGNGVLALINDDFGIAGESTQIAVVRGTGIVRE